MKKKTFTFLLLLILVIGLFVRLYRLDLRPMHHDEANQAYKFGELLEQGEYRYDPAEHHGPTLYYFSLPFAWLSGQKTYAELNEITLRLVTVFFGLVMILIAALAAGHYLKNSEKLWAALFLAASAPVTYFNRFYIQESLLAAFALAFVICLWRFWQKPDYREGAWLGLTAGLLYATKETSIIVMVASLLALVGVWLLTRRKDRSEQNQEDEKNRKKVKPESEEKTPGNSTERAWKPLLLATFIFLAVSFVFYSSFFKYPQGFLDSFKALAGYGQKGLEAGWHQHPFWYYFGLLFYHHGAPGSPVFTEIPFLALALFGMVVSFMELSKSRKSSENFRAYLAALAVITALVYSAIPYKTPWNMLTFWVFFLIVAAIGFDYLLRLIKIRQSKILLTGILLIWTGWQIYLVNYYFYAYPDNPYVYAQTSPDFMRLVNRLNDLSQVDSEGKNVLIRVIAPPEETWPLPWYLRRYGQVGYWTASEQVETLKPARLVIMSAAEAVKRQEKELAGYVAQYYSLRPDIVLVLLVDEELWQTYLLKKVEGLPRRQRP